LIIVGVERVVASMNALAIKKHPEMVSALKISVHCFFNRSDKGPEMKYPVTADAIGVKREIIPVMASCFLGSPIITLLPTSRR